MIKNDIYDELLGFTNSFSVWYLKFPTNLFLNGNFWRNHENDIQGESLKSEN